MDLQVEIDVSDANRAGQLARSRSRLSLSRFFSGFAAVYKARKLVAFTAAPKLPSCDAEVASGAGMPSSISNLRDPPAKYRGPLQRDASGTGQLAWLRPEPARS